MVGVTASPDRDHDINRPNPRIRREHQNEILVLRRVDRIDDDAVGHRRRRVDPNRRCLGRGFQSGNAEGVGRIGSRGPDQFDAITQVGDELIGSRRELDDVDHFPVAVLAGVKAIPLRLPSACCSTLRRMRLRACLRSRSWSSL